MATIRIGMIVPSLNTIAEDDFRRCLPADYAAHVHRVRLRREPGKVTPADLHRTYTEAEEACRTVADLRPAAIAYNCTGVSVADGEGSDRRLAEEMTEAAGIPVTNTMLAIKQALRALGVRSIVHVCPFEGDSSELERNSLAEDDLEIVASVGLGFTDARKVAQLTPQEIAGIARQKDDGRADALLLSCANSRAFEAVETIEQQLGKPVVTSNQAMLWAIMRLAGWKDVVPGGGRLMRL